MSDSPRACLRVGCIHQCPSAAQAGWGWPRTELAMAPSMPPQWELPAGLADLGEPVCQRGVRGHGLCWVPALGLNGVHSGCSTTVGASMYLAESLKSLSASEECRAMGCAGCLHWISAGSVLDAPETVLWIRVWMTQGPQHCSRALEAVRSSTMDLALWAGQRSGAVPLRGLAQGPPRHPHAGQPCGTRGPWGPRWLWALDPPKKASVPAGGCCSSGVFAVGGVGRAGLGSGLPAPRGRGWAGGPGAGPGPPPPVLSAARSGVSGAVVFPEAVAFK